MNRVYILLGGNLGDRFELLKHAKTGIRKAIGEIIVESSVYESAPWGFVAEQNFLNQVIIVETTLLPQEVLENCLNIESALGRVRSSEGYQSRTMDIDILFYNDDIIITEDLKIPHERLHERRFTLEPLVEISPNYVHPKLNKSLKEILKECMDKAEIKKVR